MTTRKQHLNSRGKTLGDALVLLDKQSGWHKAYDSEHILWPTYGNYGEIVFPAGIHTRKPTSIDGLPTIYDYLNELKLEYNLHIADTDYHSAADSTNNVTAAAATSQATADTLAIELKAKFNDHILGGGGGAHTHTVAAHTHSLHLNNADVVDGVTTRINAGTNLLGANTGADILIAGVASTAGAGGIVQVAAGVTGSGGGPGTGEFHTPYGDNINTILSLDSSNYSRLQTLTLELVLNYGRHLFIGALAMDEDI